MMPAVTANQFRPATILVGAIVLLSVTLAACAKSRGDAEVELRQWIQDAEVAASSESRRDLMALVSPDYGDRRDNERADIDKILRVYFLRHNNIRLLTSIDEIRVFENTAAEIELTVGMAGTSKQKFGFNADAYRFLLELHIEDDDWRLISATWGEVGEEIR